MHEHDNLITAHQLSREDILAVLDRAAEFDGDEHAANDRHPDKLVAMCFFEPSTRTKMSFEAAAKRLGGDVVDMGHVESSSVKKGESLADTVRVIEGYADAIVLRHPEQGSAKLAAEFTDAPVLNGGDGAGHHPTQTLLDLYTIRKHAELDDLSIGIMGDLKYGRTVHSLARALANFDADQYFVSPDSLRLPEDVRADLQQADVDVSEHASVEAVIDDIDVLYVTRIQRERFPDEDEYRKVAGQYEIDRELVEEAGSEPVIMHPLPRVTEIAPDIDALDNARYFEQAHNGIPVRMALLDHFFQQ